MSRSRSHVRVALSSGTADSEPGREFIQERLAVFAFWSGILSFGFLLLRVAAEAGLNPLFSWIRLLTDPGFMYHAAGSTVALTLWAFARESRPLAVPLLRRLDAGITIALGTCFAAMGVSLARGGGVLVGAPSVAMLTATLAVAFTMMWRAVAVPSTPGRTAAITTVAVLPLLVGDVVALWAPASRAPAATAVPIFAGAWCVMTVVTATVASDIIFGLRREVQRARQLGQYTLEEKIGEGAMGLVYRARHSMLRRPTAIKLLPPERAGQASLKRFEREVQLTSQLTHPNTVAVYDYGRTPDGVFYYAMEFLEGLNLEELVRAYGPQPDGRVIHILQQVCRALVEAHALGLIHRDIKPANVILTERGGEPDVAKVVDFGLVTRLDAGDAGLSATMEAAPVLAGTPLYLSPEAISTPERVDARTDLYALGGVGYLLLTGERLFEAQTVMELCAHHLHTPPVPPSVKLGRAVDPVLEGVLLRCLAKSPDDRPRSALALHAALGACETAGTWTLDDARAWWAAHRQRAMPRGAPVSDPEAATMTVDLGTR